MNAQQREAIRYCEDCKWCRPAIECGKESQWHFAKCTNPYVSPRSLVAKGNSGPYCDGERAKSAGFWGDGKCGRQGRLWEAK